MSSCHGRLFPFAERTNGIYFLGTPARSARTWVIVSQKISSTFSFDKPTTSTFATPATSRRTTLGSGSLLGPPLLADGEGGNRTRSIATFAFNHRCETYHCGNFFLSMDILASNF